ncbi:peptidylprolyl isomerase [Alteromonas aestuariivivens]|uniref:Periplasmic chaperone PpiD n=1 Tax=Alteromonas aestuariivivens TaxID=1938339 RepID=A0A3D8MGF8_9ALTE|nr:SurA N-terminal domain-containing protein [Alteromonas aestuariivivens]RDV29308.1 peptidylprolyl isomerase [Alteromonas aestuariivivens]
MLERIREGSQGPWAMVIIGLVVLSFVFAGVGSYLTSSGSSAAATVNGEEISLSSLERAYQNQRARMESQYGEAVASLFASEGYTREFRRNVLERLINEKLIEQKARDLGLRVSDEQIKQTIVQMPEFQYAGQFDNERYQAVLRQSGFQPSDFRDYLRVQMTREQLARGLSATAFALPGEIDQAYQLQSQTRDARYLTIESGPFEAQVTVSDDEIFNYYQANLTAFDTDELVDVAFVLLRADELKDDVQVTDEDIAEFYQNNLDRYRTAEQRRVSHILVEFGDDEEAAKQQAESLLTEINNGADFAEVAEKNSADAFSAENGGDLDFISANEMDPAFDEAAFALAQVGDVSSVVRSDFGFHIIKLTDIKAEEITALESVSEEIRDTLLTDKAMERYYELQNTMAEIAFEMPDTLEDVAGAIDGRIQQTGLFSRQSAPAPLNVPQAIEVAFSPELIEEGVNSEVIELDDGQVAVMRVVAHEPQRTQALEEVKDGIVATLRAQKAQQEAENWATALVEKIQAGEDAEALLAERDLSWQTAEAVTRNTSEVPRALVSALFRLAPEAGNSLEISPLASGDVGIVELLKINPPAEMEEAQQTGLRQRISMQHSQSDYENYIAALRADADISISEQL